MNEGQYKKKMQHLLEINNALYKENQKLKKELEEALHTLKINKYCVKGAESYLM